MTVNRFRYSGSVPGGVSTEFTLFDTTTANVGIGGNFFTMMDIARFRIRLNHVAAGTLKWYRSHDAGLTWRLDGQKTMPAISSGADEEDWLVEGNKDWKLTWVNGGTTQAAALVGDTTASATMTDYTGKTFRVHVDNLDFDVVFLTQPADVDAVAAAIQAQVGASVMTCTNGTGTLTFTSARSGTASIIQLEAGTLALATLGCGTNNQAIGWMVDMNSTSDRHPLY